MTNLYFLPLLLALAVPAASRSFLDAISSYPDLSNFTSLVTKYPAFSATFLNGTGGITLLAPSNIAFLYYQYESGRSIDTLDDEIISRVLQYHTLNATVKSQDMTVPGGAVVGSQLVDKTYNNRGKWADSNVKNPGQVVYLMAATAGEKLKGRGLGTRQSLTTATVNSGDGAIATVEAVDGSWDGGLIQIVDRFLTLPNNCTSTMTTINLSAMTAALSQTNKADAWNVYQGITCLAFANITATDNATLARLLDAHTIKSPQYTPQLRDGQLFGSEADTTIRVAVKGADVWFGDARVVRANVVTNNGVIHVLDKPITPNSTAVSTPSSTSSSTATTTAAKKSLGNPAAGRLDAVVLFLSAFFALVFAC
ncbi:MAG: hypothetical protein M1839_003195 [Geoglossum umbratile]|nr:MAG: hypothetical protein M1839_003195 [Geoglossum umbratile]